MGLKDELPEKMSSLGRAPREVETPGEVSEDEFKGDLDVLMHEMGEKGTMCEVGGNKKGGEAKSVSISNFDPNLQSEISLDVSVQGASNSIKQRVKRGSVDFELGKDRNIDKVYPYLRISEYLNTITGYSIYRSWQAPPPPCGAKPLVPHASPKSGLVDTKQGGMAVVKLVSKDNLFAPDFYGDRRTGHASWLTGFICPDSYSISFDIMGGCRVCCS